MIHHNNKGTLFGKRTNNPREHTKRQHYQSAEKFISLEKKRKIDKTNNNQAEGREQKDREAENINYNRN